MTVKWLMGQGGGGEYTPGGGRDNPGVIVDI